VIYSLKRVSLTQDYLNTGLPESDVTAVGKTAERGWNAAPACSLSQGSELIGSELIGSELTGSGTAGRCTDGMKDKLRRKAGAAA
jgi:hypothetical protein